MVAIAIVVVAFQTLQSAVDRERDLERKASEKSVRAKMDQSSETQKAIVDEQPVDELDTDISDAENPVVSFQQLGRDDGEKAWRRIQPHLVTLEIATPLGPHRATGLVVDPRGWVMTAYQTCRDASSIRVRATAPTLQQTESSDLLSDQVRGVLAIDVERDLVLLSVNPRFAPLNRVAIDSADSLVEGRFLFQCEPPTNLSPDAITETRVDGRAVTMALPRKQQTELLRMKMSHDGVEWIMHRINQATQSGTVLLNESGEVAAMHLLALGKEGLAVPAIEFQKVIETVTDEVQPIESLTPPGSASGLVILQPKHPLYEISLRLNQAGDACRQFQCLPESEDDAASLSSFVQSLAAAKRVDVTHPGADTIQRQREFWINSIDRSLNQSFPEIGSINSYAAKAFDSGGPGNELFAIVTYELIDIESDQLIMRLIDTDKFVRFPFDDRVQPMRPGEQWLLMVKLPADGLLRRRVLRGGATIEYRDVELIEQLGPLGR